MAIETQKLPRVFKFKERELTEPNEDYTVQQCIDFYANIYPEINNAKVTGPKIQGDSLVYTLGEVLGQHG